MKVFQAVYENDDTQGVYGISLVENPAMQDEWIALSEQKQEVTFSAVDEKKRLLLGAVLIPNKKIYRNMNGNEFYITFDEDTIGDLAHDFIKNGFQNNSTEEHEVKLNDVSFVESWQVENPNIDKSALYGKTYEKGTWVTMAKVSPEIYEKATNGTFKGFSIDALLGLKEVNFKSNIEMNKEESKSLKDSIIDGVKALLSKESKVELNEDLETTETIEESTELEVEDIQELSPESMEAIKEALGVLLSEVKTDVAKQIEDFKVEFSKKEEEKTEEIKAELSKTPEVEAIVSNPEVKDVKLSKDQTLFELLRKNK